MNNDSPRRRTVAVVEFLRWKKRKQFERTIHEFNVNSLPMCVCEYPVDTLQTHAMCIPYLNHHHHQHKPEHLFLRIFILLFSVAWRWRERVWTPLRYNRLGYGCREREDRFDLSFFSIFLWKK